MPGLVGLDGKQLVAPRTPPRVQASMTRQGVNQTSYLGPGEPIAPRAGYSVRPRGTDYPVGVNISTSGRASWGRTSYEALKGIIDAYDVARACINHKIDEIRSMDVMFVPADGVSGDVSAAIDVAQRFMDRPDQENEFDAWVNILMENALRYDAPALYRRRNYDGEVIGYEVLDGTTIFPYVDEHGRRPLAPAPAYYQRIKGMVDVWLTQDDVTWAPFRPQNDPYGLAPMESVLLNANTDMRFQWHFLQLFTDGTVPAGFMELPDDISSPDQVAEWQDYWDAFTQGDQTILHRLIAVPGGTKVTDTKPATFDKAFPQYLMMRTCAAFGVVPQDLGFVDDVNRANGETQTDIQFRVNTLPWVRWLQRIVSRFLQRDLGLPVKMLLDTGRDKEDRVAEANAWKIYIESGMASPDEARQEVLGLPVDNERPIPRGIISNRQGFIPFNQVLAISGKVDPETAAPADDAVLPVKGFDGTPGLMPDKLPGGAVFHRAPIDHDNPGNPGDEVPVPGTDVVGQPAQPVAKGAESSELAAFRRFVKTAVRRGRWRDFVFTGVDGVAARRLNQGGLFEVRKAAGLIGVAGLCVQAVDTGRVLVLQRALDPSDDAGGMLEFPGGHLEDGESPFDAAVREWQEETGSLLPVSALRAADGVPVWGDGKYAGFILTVPDETVCVVRGPGQVVNPDDPDGDVVEAVMWVDPQTLVGNSMVRDRLAEQIGEVLTALVGDDASPLVKGWRDTPPRTPKLEYDLPLTDHYAPLIATALRDAVGQLDLTELARRVAQVVTVATEDGYQRAAAEVVSDVTASFTALADVLKQVYPDAWLAGEHAAQLQLSGAVPTVDVSAAVGSVDWSHWSPGSPLAADAINSDGLTKLLDSVGVTVQGIERSVLDQIGGKIADGLSQGLPADRIAADITDLVGSGSRAELIAHTETARGLELASFDVYSRNGVTEWDLVTSAGACPVCLQVEAANPHPVSDMSDAPPVHPRCRCSSAPRADSIT